MVFMEFSTVSGGKDFFVGKNLQAIYKDTAGGSIFAWEVYLPGTGHQISRDEIMRIAQFQESTFNQLMVERGAAAVENGTGSFRLGMVLLRRLSKSRVN